MIRRLKKDVLKELPTKRRQVIELPCTEKAAELVSSQLAIMDNWNDRLIDMRVRVELAKVSDDPADYASAIMELQDGHKASFAETAKLAHDVAMAKIPFVIEHVLEAIEEGKVILFAHHLDVIAELKNAFGDSAVVITGEVDCDDRQKAVDRFQSDPECKVFIGGLKAAGVGLTLTASSHVVFAELDWVPATMSQAEDRAHRIGQTDSVLSQLLVMEGSLDAHIARTLVSKMKVIDAALDVNHDSRALSETPIPPESVAIRCIPTEPVIYSRQTDDEVHADYDAKEQAAANLTPEKIQAIHQALKIITGLCDGASRKDGAGFSKFDSRLGHKLAAEKSLTPRQALLGQKLTHKYRRQLGEDLAAACQEVIQCNKVTNQEEEQAL
jgi:SWI/SNF-related matrix-associated actin-dependent regulator 1 of chromatin subfamily A